MKRKKGEIISVSANYQLDWGNIKRKTNNQYLGKLSANNSHLLYG